MNRCVSSRSGCESFNGDISRRVPPQNIDAERVVIGSILLGQAEAGAILDDVAAIVRADDFYLADNGAIFRAMRTLNADRQPIDAVTIAESVMKNGGVDAESISALLVKAMDSVPHSGHAKHHAELVAEAARRRSVIRVSGEASSKAFEPTHDISDVIATTSKQLDAITENGLRDGPKPVAQILPGVLAELNQPRPTGVPTGFSGIDKKITGLRPGNLVVIAARPSVGKTAFAGNIALNVLESGGPVLFVSLEMTRRELLVRFLSRLSGLPVAKIESIATGLEADRDRFVMAAQQLSQLPLSVDDANPRTLSEIAAAARVLHRKQGLGLIVVDYLQLIAPEDKRAPREQQVAEMSRSLKHLAKGLSVPVIALAQLSREIEKREDKTPRLSDLRESGAIEQDADVVVFLDRPHACDTKADPNEAKAYVRKNRHGDTGPIALRWTGSTMTFRDGPSSSPSTDWNETPTPEFRG